MKSSEPARQVDSLRIREKPIYVCENHEMAFYYWCKTRKEMKVNTFFLVMIDWHTDLMQWGGQLDLRKEVNQLDLNELDEVRELASRSRTQNDNIAYRQPRAAMEAGLVTDVLLITHEVPYEKTYEDLSGRKHRIFHCLHPNDLRNLVIEVPSLKESIDYPEGNRNIILDIDLDFFTYEDDEGKAHVIDEEDFKHIFPNAPLIWWICEKARLITIAKEPHFCGGIENSERILKLLNVHLLTGREACED